MMFWNRNKKEKAAAGNEKNRFDHLLSVAEKLPVKALPDLIRAIVRPVQSDFLLAVAEEGTDARPDMTPQEFFFEGLIQVQSFEKMKEGELDGADYPLSLASEMVLPWP
ncbi:FipA [Escherichia coli]|nr:FipA [Escherichia coli]